MKKVLKKLKIVSIDVFIYRMKTYKPVNIENNYVIESTIEGNNMCYYIKDNNKIVHKSYLFSSVFLLRSINKKGPAIGDCSTISSYRGQSIYPYVINKIAKDVINNEGKEVFVIVNTNNISSIKGIEKAGFSKMATVRGKRWLWFYLKREIIYHNKQKQI